VTEGNPALRVIANARSEIGVCHWMRTWAPLIFLAACHSSPAVAPRAATKPIPSSSSSIAIADAGAPPVAIASAQPPVVSVRAKCAEPSHLVQLGTVKEWAGFGGEELVGSKYAYDPETLAQHERPVTPDPPEKTGRYDQVVGDFGLIADQDASARVENVRTHKLIVSAPVCTAGGAWEFSLSPTGRFLLCESRDGTAVIDLHPAHGGVSKDWCGLGKGSSLSPNDRYTVDVPVLVPSENGDIPDTTRITRTDIDTGRPLTLLQAPRPEYDDPYRAAFCGAGQIFVVSGEDEIVVFRSDGTRLASAPAMRGGVVSFSASGHYVSQSRGDATTVFRLDL
jgi:hypothetical protein